MEEFNEMVKVEFAVNPWMDVDHHWRLPMRDSTLKIGVARLDRANTRSGTNTPQCARRSAEIW